MPHKKAKGPKRKQGEVDLPVDTTQSDDTPKSFTRLMRYKDITEQKRKEKKEQQAKKKANKDKQEPLKPFEGERLRDFTQRVEIEYQKQIKEAKPLSARKRRNREARKEKEREKKQRQVEKYGGRDFDDLRDNVKFGEVADAPPVFNKLPKARGRGKETLEAKTRQATKDEERMEQTKASNKRKLQNMSMAARQQLENERDRAIEMYRAKKAKKMAASGLTPI
ncbi:hypothetical protein O0I10_002547 [Lichtheimia ornata]|uniref:Coiled-coil domain-containing protein 137 n=1 Tax=Lichtheimia ornata TaxID=688661 RepID=A0AAD7VBD8_9FUNG|nr:uncharacterized protein O0I10_002547 [Lichtheimia ornata]KAJ8661740.1 hypothetical protein O0I10_002547 [Lichtheimia ornata]